MKNGTLVAWEREKISKELGVYSITIKIQFCEVHSLMKLTSGMSASDAVTVRTVVPGEVLSGMLAV